VTDRKILFTFGKKILRRIYGPTQGKGRWRPRLNSEICNKYTDLNIVDDFKIRRTETAGHVIRMESERISKKILNGKFHNKRAVGKPRTRGEDVVRRDTSQILGIRGWRRRAEHREEWSPGSRKSSSDTDGK